ncbi:Putative fungal lipase-like domain, alpha/Beta hydrolase [Colletotrichum destructivum]|uniref:Fungal lipase-like domain, alpha/Beta hydrolase n=1 Tax=Colletotrichum destructivum TaxID=34406 RepID=A0AAX4I9A1_9PEZI|nr:Putative fungal lipase-like domain, alpha/Beta hydrolase [Colletotrichum destructivum]
MLAKLSLLPLLSAAVSASPLLDARAPVAALDERAVTVSAADLSNFEYYVQMVAATSCNSEAAVGASITCSADSCPDVEANGAKIVGTFSGLVSGLQGYVATDPVKKNIVIAIRGSNNVRNWITNILFAFDDCDFVDDCKVHTGFANAWNEVKNSLLTYVKSAKAANPNYTIIATGHSLGGAVATIAAADLRRDGYAVDLYTYGSPRVGNDAFVNFVTVQAGAEYRITHVDDPVPRLPPILFGYRHTSPEYWLSTGSATTIDYDISDIKVCEGDASTKCNGGTFGLNVDAHKYYFRRTGACSTDGFEFRQREEEISDEDLAARLTAWAEQDIEISKSLGQA